MLEKITGSTVEYNHKLASHWLLEGVRFMQEKGIRFGVALDFDGNIALEGKSNGLDPRDSYVHPEAKQALIDIQKAGVAVVVISSRGAADVAQRIAIPGIQYVGSLGWETYVPDSEDLTKGVSLIHPQFLPYQTQITSILHEVRTRFTTDLGHSTDLENVPNIAIPAGRDSTVIMQRKGYNSQFPEGINITWALNMVPDDKKTQYLQAITQYFEEAFTKQTDGLTQTQIEELKQLCGLVSREGMTTDGHKTLDVEIRPLSNAAKAEAMTQLLAIGDSLEHFVPMPKADIWIFSGDHTQQDWPVMERGHQIAQETQGKKGVIGVWSKSQFDNVEKVPDFVDVVVDGVFGNAALLKEMAAVIKRS
jgi:hydroxymethylpyrimidine pyrophosphatase-like HAD family hydrolase